ncbi:MAG: PTS transporter subunit EIIC [Spirochaetaceae bacterium]|jgi:PTS system cellobiose-specific IIC component|nr:PTS transporter subunit EIIC [Spirochaetaceae bacterium]
MTFVDRLTSAGYKISTQRHLSSVKDGFISLMPLILVGSAALIVKNLPIPGWASIAPAPLITWCNNVWWGTFAFLAVFAVFSIAYHLAKTYNADEFRSGFVALACYFALIPQGAVINGAGAWGWITWQCTSTASLFMAIIVPLLASEIFIRLNRNEKLLIKLPSSVPPGVGKSFSVLIPAGLTITIFVVAGIIIEALSGLDAFAAVAKLFESVVSAADSLVSGLLIVFLNQAFWILGLHGPSLVGSVLEPVSLNLMTENMAAFTALGGDLSRYSVKDFHIMTKPFLDTFVYIGGSGTTLGLLIAVFFVGRSKLYRSLAKGCIVPGLFEINEPVIFGLPIVLNPVLAVPFILAPIAITILSYLAIAAGVVRATVAILPWATPPIVSGYLATGGDIKACILQLINIAIAVLIYMPFIKVVDNIEAKNEAGGNA